MVPVKSCQGPVCKTNRKDFMINLINPIWANMINPSKRNCIPIARPYWFMRVEFLNSRLGEVNILSCADLRQNYFIVSLIIGDRSNPIPIR